MPIIGTVTQSPDGRFDGSLHTLLIQCPLAIIPTRDRPSDAAPDYRVVAATLDIGAGWVRRDEATGAVVVSLALAMPEFGPRRLYCQLVRSDAGPGQYALRWVPAD